MKPILCASLVALGMLGMSFGQTPSNPAAQSASPQRQVPAPGNNQLARMRDDLNKLESLNLNMSSAWLDYVILDRRLLAGRP